MAQSWHQALAETDGGWQASEALRLGLVQLKSWPNIPDLPPEQVAPVTRICALLSHKPTVGFLVGRLLELGEDESRRLLLLLHRFGHVEVLQRRAGAEPPSSVEVSGPASGVPGAFLGRLWKKLIAN